MAERRMPSSPRRRPDADIAAVIFDLDNCLAAADEAARRAGGGKRTMAYREFRRAF